MLESVVFRGSVKSTVHTWNFCGTRIATRELHSSKKTTWKNSVQNNSIFPLQLDGPRISSFLSATKVSRMHNAPSNKRTKCNSSKKTTKNKWSARWNDILVAWHGGSHPQLPCKSPVLSKIKKFHQFSPPDICTHNQNTYGNPTPGFTVFMAHICKHNADDNKTRKETRIRSSVGSWCV